MGGWVDTQTDGGIIQRDFLWFGKCLQDHGTDVRWRVCGRRKWPTSAKHRIKYGRFHLLTKTPNSLNVNITNPCFRNGMFFNCFSDSHGCRWRHKQLHPLAFSSLSRPSTYHTVSLSPSPWVQPWTRRIVLTDDLTSLSLTHTHTHSLASWQQSLWGHMSI